MRNSVGPLLRRATLCALSLAVVATPGGPAVAAPAPPAAEAAGTEFAQRYHALQHGGITRAANTAITCREPMAPRAVSCPSARGGGMAANNDFDMFYVDVDKDPNTYNSSRGEVRLPPGSRVTYARLYWGGNLHVGERKPPRDNGKALIAEPGGSYRDVRADTLAGHRTADGADAFQASADVTRLVRSGGPGLYTVAQVNVAMGHSKAGAWGGWTLVVAYEDKAAPLRHLSVWDGFDSFGARGRGHAVRLGGMPVPGRAKGSVGMVAYDGDRGTTGDTLTVSTDRSRPVRLSDAANPAHDVLNSTISEPGRQSARTPAYANTLGYDSDIFRLDGGLKADRKGLLIRLASRRESAWAGVLFAAVDAKR
ncbi:DUF3344 domain-containing protein [Streptomyces sp. BA2]|uniref:DUF3344 domain-containing protein n=1 Tax=Streptomyces sp. BA2 TaxID=436595 RepID=UPI0013239459|nr:DUF3344 domain-containing protein [Streptomyces sp. BA2]MWA13367.1 DUF3344 domain-containing protein [Streptomyces sp. BA2]